MGVQKREKMFGNNNLETFLKQSPNKYILCYGYNEEKGGT